MACTVVMENNPQLGSATRSAQHHHLEGRPQDANAARTFVGSQLAGAEDDVVEAAKLLTSELVTNVLLHVGGPMLVGVSRSRDWILVTVADEERRAVPRPRPAPDIEMLAESGRGFQIIVAEATDFGWHTMPDGTSKVVWFTLPTQKRAVATTGQ